jgi:phosphoglucomutase
MIDTKTFKFKGSTWRITPDGNTVLLLKVELIPLTKKKNKPQQYKEHTVNYLRSYSVDQLIEYIAEMENCGTEPIFEAYEGGKIES